MANWYRGVLKYVDSLVLVSPANSISSTGKRRYGHPALNGVLPEPWLPLKKGQTLVNHDHAGPRTRDGDQAVVLTLRKKPSLNPRRRAHPAPGEEYGDLPPPSASTDGLDMRPPLVQRSQTAPVPLHHRLSFDEASGVIMLPENDGWMGDEVDSEEEDFGTPTPPEHDDDEAVPSNPIPVSPRHSRYGTYFHHPERRRQQIPGAFPRS